MLQTCPKLKRRKATSTRRESIKRTKKISKCSWRRRRVTKDVSKKAKLIYYSKNQQHHPTKITSVFSASAAKRTSMCKVALVTSGGERSKHRKPRLSQRTSLSSSSANSWSATDRK